MYLVGAPHANKAAAQRLLELCVTKQEELVTDVEVFQEILHRYLALQRPECIDPAWMVLTRLAVKVYPLEEADVRNAREIVRGASRLSARDAVHVAVMKRHGVSRILSFDRDLDELPGIQRLS